MSTADPADAAGPAGRAGPEDGGLEGGIRRYAGAGSSCALRVAGNPGGIIFLADGGICGCQTPGAPGLEVILLRSGRLTEADWEAAFSSAAAGGRSLTEELVRRDLLGAGEAEALLRTALADAIFAVLAGRVDGWAEAAADCPMPLAPPARPGWLLGESIRRRQALAALAGPPVSPRDRVTAASPGAWRQAASWPDAGQLELLGLCNGRRTVRDLAFARGSGLYATLLELARLRDRGLVAIAADGAESVSPSRSSGIPSDAGESDRTVAGLPGRHADHASGTPRTGTAGRRYLAAGIQLLRPRSSGSALPGGHRDPPS